MKNTLFAKPTTTIFLLLTVFFAARAGTSEQNSIEFTKQGLHNFFSKQYNSYEYSDMLAHDFSHCVQLLQHGQDAMYQRSVLKLFLNKMKTCYTISYEALLEFMSTLPSLVASTKPTLTNPDALPLQTTFNDTLINAFSSADQFKQFQTNPRTFLQQLSCSLTSLCPLQMPSLPHEKTLLQQTIVRFLETGVQKMVWSINEQENSWVQTKEFVQKLEMLLQCNVLTDSDDIDDLCWSLIHRYLYFLNVAKNNLDLAFFKTMQHDIETNKCTLLSIEEQEDNITTKKQHMLHKVKELVAYKEQYETPSIIA